ncbi:MAG: biotin--[acetyl-CoA-carboxylase] ligase [Spirochaetaceae bacterium]|nr:biotin--[acetyl-CoA-carboxylase] ligase [Spirochaetaceae bacterium]
MKLTDIENPFGGAVYYFDSCTSTMDEARRLAGEVPHGTVVVAALQTGGRGRFSSRRWAGTAGKNLTFTLILRYAGFSSVPGAVTLRSGIAVARAIEALEPVLAARIAVKWPNDVMLGDKKCAGIIAESDGSMVLIGIGVNVAEDFGVTSRKEAPDAVSIVSALAELDGAAAGSYAEAPHRIPFILEKVLFSLANTLSSGFDDAWREEFEKRLYLKGRTVRFVAGNTAVPRTVTGTLAGISAGGEIILIPDGKTEAEAFAAGEITSNCRAL